MRWDWFVVPQSPLPWHNFQLLLGRSSSVKGGGTVVTAALPGQMEEAVWMRHVFRGGQLWAMGL